MSNVDVLVARRLLSYRAIFLMRIPNHADVFTKKPPNGMATYTDTKDGKRAELTGNQKLFFTTFGPK